MPHIYNKPKYIKNAKKHSKSQTYHCKENSHLQGEAKSKMVLEKGHSKGKKNISKTTSLYSKNQECLNEVLI